MRFRQKLALWIGGAFLCVILFLPQSLGAGKSSNVADRARSLLREAGIRGGMVLHLGCSKGRLTAELHRDGTFLVRGLDRNRANVRKAREHIRSRGLYGQVSVGHLSGKRLPMADNLVNIVVAEEGRKVPAGELMRVLAPGGVAYLEKDDGWVKKAKSRPGEIDEWTHFLHDASNNAVADDSRVAPPRRLKWKGTPMWCRSHEFASSIHSLVTANDRLFGIIDEGIIGQPRGVPAQWTLVARDAFNGALLWKRPAARSGRRTLVASGDKVYVTLGRNAPLSILDAASGETLKACEKTGNVEELIYREGLVICRSRNRKEQRRSGDRAERVIAVDGDTGQVRWSRATRRVAGGSLAAENGRVCYYTGEDLVTLDLPTGEKLWAASADWRGGYVVMHEDVVLLTGNRTAAFDAQSGEKLWTAGVKARSMPGVFVADGLIWAAWTPGAGPERAEWRDVKSQRRFAAPRGLKMWEPTRTVRRGYDPRTGEVARSVAVERLVTPGHHIRCYPPKATERYLLLNKRGVEFLGLRGDDSMRHNWLRAPCGYGVLPANGLLYMPPHQCFCYPGVNLTGFNALTGKGGTEAELTEDATRLARGPAWGEAGPAGGSSYKRDWPTYRHDPQRSGSVEWNAPSEPERLWAAELGATLSPPVAADGKIFVAGIDSHCVRCLDAESGDLLWTYTTGARVDSPPTIHEGRVLFGSTDGNAYCLRVSDGQLIWRFRAAPGHRRISVRGQLESSWPSHGSVLVRDGLAYVTAGRSSYLYGGIRIYALDPATGEVVHSRHLDSGRPDVSKSAGRPFDMEGARSDILVAGDEDIYMFQERFNQDLSSDPMPRITKLGDRETERHLMSTSGFLDRRWSNGAFNRAYWTYSNRWPGYYFGYEAPKWGQLLVFDEETTYAAKYYTRRHGHSPEFRPGTGYRLVADRNTNDPVLRPARFGQEKGGGFSRGQFWKWSEQVPVRIEAMVLAGNQLYVAGPPDLGPDEGAMAAMQGRRGARFTVLSASKGEKLFARKMEDVPVFDGLIAAYGRLYMATKQGTVVCLSGAKAD